MNNYWVYLPGALITGALIPVQAATNAAFSKSTGNPLVTGLVVSFFGLATMLLFILLSGTAMPLRRQLVAAPWYSYLGGPIVATYILMITVLVPRIGVGSAIGLIVTGQIIGAVIIDHFGFFSVPVQAAGLSRSTGLVLMIAGIYLVMKK